MNHLFQSRILRLIHSIMYQLLVSATRFVTRQTQTNANSWSPRVDNRVVMHVTMVRKPDRRIVRTLLPVKRVDRVYAVAVHFNRSIVHFAESLDLDVVSVNPIEAFAADVRVEVFGNVFREEVRILGL